MGNDTSRLKGLVIDKNAVEVNDFWALFNAESPTTSNEDGHQLLSVFQGEHVVNGQLWVSQGPMERAIKNLMIYRHPYILKYVATWVQGGQKHLATERVQPLTAVLPTQSDLQVCLGLRTILCSLIFLIEKAMARHLNICTSSIYITNNGSWRLAGFEYVWKCKEITKNLLDLANAYRYKPAIDASELKANTIDFIEQYAFGTLCEEILTKCTKSDIATPHAQEFREYCASHLKHKNPLMRPKLSAVLLHPYFNHEFVLIHSFLFELPLKSVQEKQDFFTGLIDRLRYFNEDVVGAHLAADLLSRMVLLDPTAQLCVTPYVLKTKTDHSAALFSNQTYVRHLMPHLKKMFRLRDAQIRLILLEYFMEFVRLLKDDEIQEYILPHLLAGMNDTNDVLVAKTLRCLADLVPILGAATVIGGNRSRLFSDGRPQAAVSDSTTHWVEPRSITPVMGNEVDYMLSESPLPETIELSGSFNSSLETETNVGLEMPLRLSPDGGEDDKSAIITDGHNNELIVNDTDIIDNNTAVEIVTDTAAIVLENFSAMPTQTATIMTPTLASTPKEAIKIDIDDEEAWSDWETDELQRLHMQTPGTNSTHTNSTIDEIGNPASPLINKKMQSSLESTNQSPQSKVDTTQLNFKKKKINDDINALDIQVQKTGTSTKHGQSNEFDFFKDMEPVIDTKSNKNLIISAVQPINKADQIVIDSSRFAANGDDTAHNFEGDGWGVEDDDVDDDDTVWNERL